MADRLFERAFQTANLEEERRDDGLRREKAARSQERTQEQQLRSKATGMTAADAIQRILLAAKDRDYFR